MNSQQSTIAPFRGLRAAVLSGLGGAIAPAAILGLFTVCRWFIEGAPDIDRQYDLNNLQEKLLLPVIGCSSMSACAGWATFALFGNFRFAKTLAIIFAICLPLWFILNAIEFTPRRLKSIDHPAVYPSELIVLIGSPIAAAAFLTAIRISGSRRSTGPERKQASTF